MLTYCTEEKDTFDYPQGFQRREAPLDASANSDWKQTKWVWRSNGKVPYNGRMVERRSCVGVIECSSCQRPVKTKTQAGSRRTTLEEPCVKCGGSLHQIPCSVTSYHFESIDQNGEPSKVWEHHGHHQHSRPPASRISPHERNLIETQIQLNPDASTLKIRTGTATIDSIPLGNINPVLTNPRAARYAVSRAREAVGARPSGTGGFWILLALGNMQAELGEHCIINSSFNGPTFFCFQTTFMRTVLSESVNFWLDNGDAVTHDRNGFVTDGDHSFFREGNLLATCAFSTVLNAWCPVLYTWISRLDTDHHRPHFYELFKSVHLAAGERFDSKLFFNVSVFSLYSLAGALITFKDHGFLGCSAGCL